MRKYSWRVTHIIIDLMDLFSFFIALIALHNSLTYGHNNKFDGDELLLLTADTTLLSSEQWTHLFLRLFLLTLAFKRLK